MIRIRIRMSVLIDSVDYANTHHDIVIMIMLIT